MSAEAHGLKSITNIKSENEHLTLEPIRKNSLRPSLSVTLARTFLTSITNRIVNQYLPHKKNEFESFFLTLLQDKNIK